jgi:N-acetylglutamate synthase-like GNAT family acetyltransferase
MKTRVIKQGLCVSVSIVDEEKQSIIATAGMDFIQGKWWLARLVVNRAFGRQGLGRSLIQHLRENADGYPIEVMPGGYDTPREQQFAFYERCGFVNVDENTMVLKTDGVKK